MKTLKMVPFIVAMIAFANAGFAQNQLSETLKVSGECGSCKKKIEKAAKDAGASYAVWTTDTKTLTVKYDSKSTNTDKIQQKIAEVGYDTPKFKATDEAYNKLEACCQYDRSSASIENKENKMNMSQKDMNGKKDMNCSDGGKEKSCCEKKENK